MLKTVHTKYLLMAGMATLISPLSVLIQSLTREGFNLAVHPVSLLSLGEHGWIQIANFIVTGLLYIAFGFGLRRVLGSGRGGLAGPLLFLFNGAATIAGGVFTVDPMYGFPPGTPDGLPTALSWHAQVHNLTFMLAFLALMIAQFVFARRFASVRQPGFAFYCLFTGLATPVLIVFSQTAPSLSGYILYGTGLMTNVWVALLAARLSRELHTNSQWPPSTMRAAT